MKTMFIEAKSKAKISIKKHLGKLPDKLALAATAQHMHQIISIKKELEKAGKKISLVQGKHSRRAGQILGCDTPKIKEDAVLFIGTGNFHPAIFGKKDVYALNPENSSLHVFGKKEAQKLEKRKKGGLLKFYSSKNIGILISIKPGQLSTKALSLKKRFRSKNFYCLVFDTLNVNELENFPFIECFVNTACPRITEDTAEKTIINTEDIKKI